MHRLLHALVLLPVLWAAELAEIRSDFYLRDIKKLSSTEMDGRGTGGAGLEKAAAYIAHAFAHSGLKPLGTAGYYQSFPVLYRATLGNSRVSVETAEGKQQLKSEDFLPFAFSADTQVSGKVVFAGYGISAPEYGYDDYAGLDARGKIVLILRHEPQEYDNSSVFEGRVYSQHSQWFTKYWNAREHGASGMLVVSDSANHANDVFEPFTGIVGPASAGIPVLQVKESLAASWFSAEGKDFRGMQEQIDKRLEPQSFAFTSVVAHLNVGMKQETRTVHNVVGYLPGETDRYIVIGAHYDHLGHGEQYSLAPELPNALHPGADDNASGTAGVLTLARWFAAQPRRPYGVLFLAFAGEEIGLLGSSYYVTHSLLPLTKAELMVNMDMIGRIREHKVLVTGAAEGTPQRSILQTLSAASGLDLRLDDGGIYGSSDHTSFKAHGIPILFFFSGLHPDYHKPSDTWDKIDAEETVKLLRLIGGIPSELAARKETPSHTLDQQRKPTKKVRESL